MKKSLIAFAALSAVAGFAQAEDGVQLYGILDAAVAYQNHSQSISDGFPVSINNNFPGPLSQSVANSSVTGIVNGGLSDSRWGIKGSESLGQGWAAKFVLESGINLPTGQLNNAALSQVQQSNTGGKVVGVDSSLSGQLFNRMAYIGLSNGQWGELDIGRNTTPGYEVVGAYDPQEGSQLFSPVGFSGSEGGALGYTEVLRNDNSLKYSKIWNNGVNVRAIYKFSNQTGLPAAGNGGQLNLGYEPSARWGAQVVLSKYNDVVATNGALYGPTNGYQGLSGALYDTDGILIAFKYKPTQDWIVKAGYQFYQRKAPTNSAAEVGSITEFGYTFATGISGNNLNNLSNGAAAGAPHNYGLGWVGAEWNVSSNKVVRFAWYNIIAHSFVAAGGLGGQNGDMIDNQFSAVYDYYFSKRTDLYAGAMYQVYSGSYFTGANATTNFNSILTVGAGMRHRF